jgi:hypothetical protein
LPSTFLRLRTTGSSEPSALTVKAAASPFSSTPTTVRFLPAKD